MPNSTINKFPGFPKEIEKANWQFPSIINGYVHELSGAEFKVLWYILRHTYGWQKDFDKLALSQICNGIKKRDGEYVDKGTGLSKKWATNALKGLEEKGFIFIERELGKTNTIYLKIVSGVENTLVTGVESTPVPVEQNTPVEKTNRAQTGVESTHTIVPITNTNMRAKQVSPYKSLSYLLDVPLEDVKGFINHPDLKVSEMEVRRKGRELHDYCEAKGRRYKNYKAFLRNALRREFGVRDSDTPYSSIAHLVREHRI